MKRFFFLFGVFIFTSFTTIYAQMTAQQIINKSIEKAVGEKFNQANIYFTFRGKEYRSVRDNGEYQLERIVMQKNDLIHDILSNKGLSRSVNNCQIKVADSMIARISEGVNSVHYFANLPYGLNAAAVHKELV